MFESLPILIKKSKIRKKVGNLVEICGEEAPLNCEKFPFVSLF